MSYRRRIDANHHELLAVLRAGCDVLDTHHYPGFVDAVGVRGGQIYLFEFKTDDGALTPAQAELHRRFPVIVLQSIEEARAWVTLRKAGSPCRT